MWIGGAADVSSFSARMLGARFWMKLKRLASLSERERDDDELANNPSGKKGSG
jgi:hypothetical protein